MPDCEVIMKKMKWHSILLAILIGTISNVLSEEYLKYRLPGSNSDKSSNFTEPHGSIEINIDSVQATKKVEQTILIKINVELKGL